MDQTWMNIENLLRYVWPTDCYAYFGYILHRQMYRIFLRLSTNLF